MDNTTTLRLGTVLLATLFMFAACVAPGLSQTVSGFCSADLGSTDVPNKLNRVVYEDGNTAAVTVGGLDCRRPLDASNHYFYFDIDDNFIYNGNLPTAYLEVSYYDETGYIEPQYDSTDGEYTSAGAITLGGTNKWRTAVWTLTDCLFANRQNAGADFRLNVGTNSVKIDSVRVSAIPFTSYTSVERTLGSNEVYAGLSHPQNADGNTVVTTIGGRECRKPAPSSGNNYFYFNVSDAFIYNGSVSTVYLKVDYYDSPNGRILPEYDSTSSSYTGANTLYTSGANTWKQAFWTLNNVRFANRQNVSSDFRLYVDTNRSVHISKVTVSTVPFGPPAPTVTYPYGTIDTLAPRIAWIGEPHNIYQVLVEAQGEPAHHWDSGEFASKNFTSQCGQLLPNRTYHARVRLANANGWGDWSVPAEFLTPDSPHISIISPADVTALNDKRPTIRWEVSSAQTLTSQSIQINDGHPVSISTSARSYRTPALETGLYNATIRVTETGGATHEQTVRFWINATPTEAGTLYVFNISFLQTYSTSNLTQRKLFYDTSHFLATLQGIVNRNGPRLYYNYFAVDQTWLNILTDSDNGWLRSKTIVNIPDLTTLISTFRDDFNGVVEYDPNVWATSNVASTIAGVEDLVAIRKDTASGSLYHQLVVDSSGPQLPVVKSLVDMFTGTGTIPGTDRPSTGSKKCDAYIWAKIHYLDTGKSNPRKLAYWLDSYWLEKPFGTNPPEHLLFNHDYIVANRGFIFDLNSWGDETPIDDPNQPLGTDLATKKEILLSAYNAAGGKMIHVAGFTPWWFKYTDRGGGTRHPVHTEWEWVKIATAYNAFVDADATSYSDMLNASVFTLFPLPDRLIQNPKPTPDKMRRMAYMDAIGQIAPFNFIYFYIGDYDSAAWIDRLIPSRWQDYARGLTPMGWAFNPNLIDRHAAAFDYFYRTKTDQDFFIAGDSGAGYVNPTNLYPNRNPSGLPSGAAAWAEHCIPYYRQLDYSITGFLLNGFCGKLNSTTELLYRPFSADGVMTQGGWMHADSHLEQNMPVAWQIGDLPVSGSQAMADAVHPHGVAGATTFLSFRTIIRSPSQIRGTIDTLRGQYPDMRYQSVEPFTYFYLLRHYLGGNNNRRATYTFDTMPNWAEAEEEFTVQIGVRNDGWDTWYAEGTNRTVLAISLSPGDGWSNAVILPLPRDIAPGEGEILTAQLTAPPGGMSNVMYQMRTGDTGWFDAAGDLPWQPQRYKIQCEDYSGGDSAQQGVDYYDTTPGNTGGKYRNDDVDIEECSEGGYNVGWIVEGEWLRYTEVPVLRSGNQEFILRASAWGGSKQLRICHGSLDNTILTLTIPDTGGQQVWRTLSGILSLPKGLHTIYLVAESSDFNLNWFMISPVTDTTPPNAFALTFNPGLYVNNTVEVTFSTTDNPGGSGISHYVGRINGGEWTEPITSPWIVGPEGFHEGLNTLQVRAYDCAGNYRDSAIRGFVFDSIPPAAFTPVVDPTRWTDNNIVVTFSTTDDRSGMDRYEGKIGDGDFSVKTSPWTIPAGALTPGTHTVTIRAYDRAGNYTDAACVVNYAQEIAKIADFKELADGEVRSLKGKIVTYVGDGFFYISEPDRTSGIRVASNDSVPVGDSVELAGSISGAGAERYIDCVGSTVFVD